MKQINNKYHTWEYFVDRYSHINFEDESIYTDDPLWEASKVMVALRCWRPDLTRLSKRGVLTPVRNQYGTCFYSPREVLKYKKDKGHLIHKLPYL